MFHNCFIIFYHILNYNYFLYLGSASDDQATAESYWTPGHLHNAPADDPSTYVQPEDYFPSTHGLVQTHPATFSGFGSMKFKIVLNGVLFLNSFKYNVNHNIIILVPK